MINANTFRKRSRFIGLCPFPCGQCSDTLFEFRHALFQGRDVAKCRIVRIALQILRVLNPHVPHGWVFHLHGTSIPSVSHHSFGIKLEVFMAPLKNYKQIAVNGSIARLHRIRAEKALGKPLPKGAVVHHADGSRSESSPLVICEDVAYHAFLHYRMRVKAAGGDPNTDKICSRCKRVLPKTQFHRSASSPLGIFVKCKDCCRIAETTRARRDWSAVYRRRVERAHSTSIPSV